jgi:hypothetical protein
MTMTALSGSPPSGIAPPLSKDNDNDHSGLIVIVTSLALFLILASLSVRIYAASKRALGLDDCVLVAVVV